MAVYLTAFLLSVSCLYIGERNKKYKKLFWAIAMLIVSVLAGLRGSDVGTDVRTYGIGFYQRAVNAKSFIAYYKEISGFGVNDFAFIGLNYFLSRVSSDFHFGLFAYSCICNCFMCAAFNRYSKMMSTPVWLGMSLFYLTQYNLSLNAMRQMLAVAAVFLASAYMYEGKTRKQFIFYTVIAFGFHSTGLISLVIFGLYLILKNGKNTNIKKQLLKAAVMLICCAIGYLFANRIIYELVSLGVFRSNYLNYLSGGSYDQGSYISLTNVLPYLIYFLAALFFYERMNFRKKEALYFTMLCGMGLLISFSTLISTYLNRIGYYLVPFEMLYLGDIRSCFAKKSKIIWSAFLLFIVVAFWIYSIGIMNYNETIPYILWK